MDQQSLDDFDGRTEQAESTVGLTHVGFLTCQSTMCRAVAQCQIPTTIVRRDDGDQIQQFLGQLTGANTVPRVLGSALLALAQQSLCIEP